MKPMTEKEMEQALREHMKLCVQRGMSVDDVVMLSQNMAKCAATSVVADADRMVDALVKT